MTELTRRTFITTGGATVLGSGAVLLTACAPNPPGRDSGSGQPSPGGDPNNPSSGSGTPGTSALAPGTPLATLTEVPVGATHAVTIDGQEIVLARPAVDKVVAFSAICTHRGCIVAPAKGEFDCPCHGSRFAAATGEVLGGPALRALNPIPVAISGTNIVAA